jgi:type I restriction enzyme S subunit
MSTIMAIPIADFCQTGSGTTPPRGKANIYYGGTIPWVKSGELRESVIANTEELVTARALADTSLKLVPEGAILVAMYGATVGRVGILGVEATTNQAVCHIIPDPNRADSRYIFHAMQYKARDLMHLRVGGAQPNISQSTIKETKVFLPPLPEQRRIAAILDQVDELRRLRQRAIDRVNELEQAIFYEMFGDPTTNPMNWAAEELGSLCDLVRGSSPPPQGDPRYFGGEVPRLMIADITRDGMNVTPKIDTLTAEGAKRSRPMPAGSVVMAVSGAVGLPAILTIDACIHDGFVGFRSLNARVDPTFLYHYLT